MASILAHGDVKRQYRWYSASHTSRAMDSVISIRALFPTPTYQTRKEKEMDHVGVVRRLPERFPDTWIHLWIQLFQSREIV
jgi:hypothetical protein